VAKIKILVVVVQKNVVVIDADGLAKTRFVARLAADALRIGSRRKYQCASGSHDIDRTHGLITLANDARSAPGQAHSRKNGIAFFTLPWRGRRPKAAYGPSPSRGRWENIVTFSVTILLTIVPDSVTYDLSRSLEGRLPEASRKVERVRCPRVDLQFAPGRLGYQSPDIMIGAGGASLDWDRRRRVTPVQTASQEAWPEAEPLGWNTPLGESRGGTPTDERAPQGACRIARCGGW